LLFEEGLFLCPFPVRSLYTSSPNLMAACKAPKILFSIMSHHNKNHDEVYRVTLVFYYKEYCILQLECERLKDGIWYNEGTKRRYRAQRSDAL
jgi:hypothetical protein